MKNYLILIPLSIIYYSLKSTLLPSVPLPDLTILAVLYLATHDVSAEGVLLAFILGYIDDTFSGAVLGSTSFATTFIYAFVYILSYKIDFLGIYGRVIGAFSLVIIKGILCYFLLDSLGIEVNFLLTYLPTAVITALFAPAIIYLIGRLVTYKLPKIEKEGMS